MRVYTSKLTPDSGVTCNCIVIVQYTSTDSYRRLPVRVCAILEELTEFCFVFRFPFRASLLDFTSQIERLHVCYYCADVWSVLAYFVAITVSHVHRQAGQVRSSTACVCRSFHDARGRSAVHAQPWVLQRLLGVVLSHAVHWCVTHYRQAVCSDDPLSHSRHNDGDSSTKVGHEISRPFITKVGYMLKLYAQEL